jgi:hypothetical protein
VHVDDGSIAFGQTPGQNMSRSMLKSMS